MPRNKYGVNWSDESSDLAIEMALVRAGGTVSVNGRPGGLGLFHHFRAVQQLLWPDDHHHRWSNLKPERRAELPDFCWILKDTE